MASTSEVGHAKNLANIDKIIDLVTQFGVSYNPSNPQLTIAGLTILKAQCTSNWNTFLTAFATYKNVTNTREIAFKPVDKLCTTILDHVKTIGVPQQTINDISSLVTKIHGSSGKLTKADAGKIVNPNADPIADPNNVPVGVGSNTISTSQQSYDSILANFEKLIEQLLQTSGYTPNEAGIQIPNLQLFLASLKADNLNAINAFNAVNLSRNKRNLIFYGDNTGLIDVMKKVKSYVRQIFGSTSPQYHQTTAIKFVKIVSRKKKKKKLPK